MTCANCGSAAHTLIGGKCTVCWSDRQDQRAPLLRRIARLLPRADDQRAVA